MAISFLVHHDVIARRRIAQRVFRSDEPKLARYASTLPRRQVKHRSKHAAPPGAEPSPAAPTTPNDS